MHYHCNRGPLREVAPWSLKQFLSWMDAPLSSVVIIMAPEGGTKDEVQTSDNIEDRHQYIPNLRRDFDLTQLVDNHSGYKVYPCTVGMVMPWGQFINGAGRWYHPLEALVRQSQDADSMDYLARQVRQALERKFRLFGARPDQNGAFGYYSDEEEDDAEMQE